MDNALQPTIILLILSLITEKISNIVKLQKGSWSYKKGTEHEEKIRENKIQIITLIVGVIVALTAKANLFLLFNKDFKLFWTDVPLEGSILSDIVGSIICGLFLSFGAKLFHDLLDMLIQVKMRNRKLNYKAGYEFGNIETVDIHLKEDETSRIEMALLPYKNILMQIENVVSVSFIYENEKPIVQIHVNDKYSFDNLIPKQIFYKNANDLQKQVRVKVINDFEPISHGTIYPSSKIGNSNPYLNNAGSIGGRVFDENTNEAYFVSCYHVVKSPNHDWDNFEPNGNETIINISDNNSSCGLITKAIRDDQVDIAIMKPINDYQIESSIGGIGTPMFTRKLKPNDKRLKTKVKMNGMMSGYKIGNVKDIDVPVKIKYPDGKTNQFNSLISIQSINNDCFSKGGDSGSFVIDEYDYLIGILIGGYRDISYVIPIEAVLNKTQTKIIKS